MPVMDGFEAARRIRDRETGCNDIRRPIVAVTASTTAHDRLRCTDHGMDDYLTKPLTGCALKAMLLKHLPRATHLRPAGQETVPTGAS